MRSEGDTKEQAEDGLERALSAKGKLEHFLEGVLKVGERGDDVDHDDDGSPFGGGGGGGGGDRFSLWLSSALFSYYFRAIRRGKKELEYFRAIKMQGTYIPCV